MLTNEDLMKISELFDIKFEVQNKIIEDKLSFQKKELQEEIRQVRFDLREELQDMKQELRGEMQDMKGELQGEIEGVRGELREVKAGLNKVENQTHRIKLILENDIRPRLNTIESCYVDTAERYAIGIVETEALKADVDMLKNVAREHSEKLKKIQ